ILVDIKYTSGKINIQTRSTKCQYSPLVSTSLFENFGPRLRTRITPRTTTPMVTCSMCSPVSVKNVPPNCGTFGAQGLVFGVMPSSINVIHSRMCSTTNIAPQNMVAASQRTVRLRSPWLEAYTASTMVSELVNRKAVITVALMMLPEWKGVGQSGFDTLP